MEIKAVSNQSFGKGATASREYGSKRRENIDKFLTMNDNDLKHSAMQLACLQTDEKKHVMLNNVALASLPIVAGVSDAVLTRGKSVKMFGSNIKGAAARVLTASKTFGRWMGGFAVAGAVVAGTAKLEEKSKKVRKFIQEQPYTALAASFVAVGAALVGARKGFSKLVDALPLDRVNLGKKAANAAKAFNENKVVDKLAKAYVKASDNMHHVVKNVGLLGVLAAPALVGGAAILHTFNHAAVRNRQAQQNYSNLKVAQAIIAQRRAAELAE